MLPKRRPILPSWNNLQNSLLLRMGGAIAAIALLAIVGMSVSWLVAESTQGGGEAINRAGSLRMQSWRMAGLYLSAARPPRREDAVRMGAAIREFDATLDDPAIHTMLPLMGDARPATTWQHMVDEWQSNIRPHFQAIAEGRIAKPEGIDHATLLADINRFVDQLDHLVKQMEDTTEAKIRVMRLVLGVALLLTVLVVLLTVWLIHTHLVLPLKRLLALSGSVGQGDLSVRTTYTGADELGQLGRAFNLMAEDLSKLYQNLEDRVRQQTAELTRSNQSLELLYHSIARLHSAPPGREIYVGILRDIEDLLGLGHGLVCLGELGGSTGQTIASTMQVEDDDTGANPCSSGQCHWCHASAKTRISISENFHRHLTLPLSDAECQYGVLILEVPMDKQLDAWQVKLLEALSRHIGVAIGAERRMEQNRRVALLEERAVIARELHDSLAQSLAYMKIQVSRLKATILSAQPADAVLEELRVGLNSAYLQLRELLSTFRLKIEGPNLSSALEQTVAEFSQRGDFDISLHVAAIGFPLSPSEEIHILQIIRECLANVLHHAHASRAHVAFDYLPDGAVTLIVEDDGEGIHNPASPHHYGMAIMEERARCLNGRLSFEACPQGGTRVTLVFTPHRLMAPDR